MYGHVVRDVSVDARLDFNASTPRLRGGLCPSPRPDMGASDKWSLHGAPRPSQMGIQAGIWSIGAALGAQGVCGVAYG